MIPYQFEIVTALTIISAGAILTVYLFLLKANGWIGKSFNDITLTLGSERPIQKINRMKNFPSLKRNRIVKPKPESSKNSLSDKKTSTLTSPPNEIVLEKTNSTPKITKNQIFPSNNFNKEYKVYEPVSSAIEPKENDISHTIKNRLSNKQEFINVEEEKPEGCQNFLGYLKERPKNTPIPEECFACTKLIDCPKTKK